MKKSKVCILQNGLARGGTDTFVVNLCKSINKRQYEITVINPSSKEESRIREEEILATGSSIIHTCDLDSLGGKILHLKRLYSILKQGKFDIFQTNIDLFNGPNLFVAWLAGIPIRCCHSHNSMQQKALIEGNTFSIRIYQRIMRWLCWHFSNRRCGCSIEAMDFLYKGHNWRQNDYPSIIPNGIDLKKYSHKINIVERKKEIGLTAKYNLITVGRLIPQKNPLFLAKIYCELCKMRNDCDLIWIGIGPMEEQCRQIFRDNKILDRVHFLGSRNDVHDILKCCNLFCLPSAFEGLGIVLIEAQAAGLPCIVSDVVPKEANCGKCYFLSLSESYNVWAKAINDMIDDKVSLNIDLNRLQNFSIDHMTKQIEKVFDFKRIN